MARDAYIVDAVRSPIGRRNGSLSEIRADELAAQVLNGLVDRIDVDPGEIEDVQMGCVTQVGEQALNVGRGSVLVAGWPETVCATTVDRQCGSSLQAAFNGASAIQAGHLDLVVFRLCRGQSLKRQTWCQERADESAFGMVGGGANQLVADSHYHRQQDDARGDSYPERGPAGQ